MITQLCISTIVKDTKFRKQLHNHNTSKFKVGYNIKIVIIIITQKFN